MWSRMLTSCVSSGKSSGASRSILAIRLAGPQYCAVRLVFIPRCFLRAFMPARIRHLDHRAVRSVSVRYELDLARQPRPFFGMVWSRGRGQGLRREILGIRCRPGCTRRRDIVSASTGSHDERSWHSQSHSGLWGRVLGLVVQHGRLLRWRLGDGRPFGAKQEFGMKRLQACSHCSCRRVSDVDGYFTSPDQRGNPCSSYSTISFGAR